MAPVFRMNLALLSPYFRFIFWIVSVSGLFLYLVTNFVGKLLVEEFMTVNYFFSFFELISILVRFYPVK